jgi:hypothetical protein
MKKFSTFRYLSIATLVLLVSGSAFAQNVGIGQAAPKSKTDINGNLQVGAAYSGIATSAAPANGARIEGQSVIGKASGEDSRDKLSVHTSATAYTNLTGYPSSTSNRGIASYASGTQMAILGVSGGTGYGVAGMTNTTLSTYMQGGEGVYGQGEAGTTTGIPIAVHGLFEETTTAGSIKSAAMLGESNTATLGTAIRSAYGSGVPVSGNAIAGVYGNIGWNGTQLAATNRYAFGVMGDGDLGAAGTSGGDATGGICGVSANTFGILGYRTAAGGNISVYGGGSASNILIANAGRLAKQPTNQIGLGIVGDLMGGYVAGANYGMMSYGKDFGMYVQGKTITNAPIIQLTEGTNNTRVVSYAPMSTSLDITTRGKAQVRGTETFIAFDANFLTLVADPTEATITVTPTGESNGVFISAITPTGFYVKENNSGKHDVQLNWIAVAKSKQTVQVNDEIMENGFDQKMLDIMTADQNDANDAGNDKSFYHDGTKIQFGRMPEAAQKSTQKQNARGKN